MTSSGRDTGIVYLIDGGRRGTFRKRGDGTSAFVDADTGEPIDLGVNAEKPSDPAEAEPEGSQRANRRG